MKIYKIAQSLDDIEFDIVIKDGQFEVDIHHKDKCSDKEIKMMKRFGQLLGRVKSVTFTEEHYAAAAEELRRELLAQEPAVQEPEIDEGPDSPGPSSPKKKPLRHRPQQRSMDAGYGA